jgi:hypothetical protein
MRRDDIEFEEEFKTDAVNGLPTRLIVPKSPFPDSPQFKGNRAVSNFQTIDHSSDTIDIYNMKSIKENYPNAGT